MYVCTYMHKNAHQNVNDSDLWVVGFKDFSFLFILFELKKIINIFFCNLRKKLFYFFFKPVK